MGALVVHYRAHYMLKAVITLEKHLSLQFVLNVFGIVNLEHIIKRIFAFFINQLLVVDNFQIWIEFLFKTIRLPFLVLVEIVHHFIASIAFWIEGRICCGSDSWIRNHVPQG